MKRVHSKSDIVQAGLDIILSRGFNATGVEAILKQANVPKGSFYNFFASKEDFGLAVIDHFTAEMGAVMQPIMADTSLPPLLRIRKCFEGIIARFENANCQQGCLLANLGLEMSDQNEMFRQRLEEALQHWIGRFAGLVAEAQREQAIRADLDPEMLAESLIASFEGALFRAKVKRSPEPLKSFLYLHFDVFLA